MRITFATLLSVAASLVFGSCDVFSPDFGQDPFRCGSGDDGEPRCPEGYGPVQRTDVMCVCEEGAPADPPGVGFVCNDDPNEDPGNNSISNATATTIGMGPLMWSARGVAICDAGDVDVYAVSGNVGQTVTAILTFRRQDGMLALEIQNEDGLALSTGETTGEDLSAALQLPAGGAYFVQVSGESSETNNYMLKVTVANP